MKRFLLNVSLFLIFNSSCSDYRNKGEIIINQTSYGEYPAIFFDLSSGNILKFDGYNEMYPNDIDEKIDADLWIEPSDPEIAGLENSFEGYQEHIGSNVLIKVLSDGETEKSAVEQFPIGFSKKITKSKIKNGTEFIVYSSEEFFYKMKIVYFKYVESDRFKKNNTQSEIKFLYEKLNIWPPPYWFKSAFLFSPPAVK